MSRYSIPAQNPALTIVVGWDNPLLTFFAQVFDPSIEEDEEACLLWIGTAPEAIPTVTALQAQLVGWATIPADIVDRLLHDQHAATPPTPLQRWAHQVLHSIGETRLDRASPAAGGVPCAPLWPQTTIIEHMGGFFYGDPTASDTLRHHDQQDPRAAGAGHGALA